MTDPSPFGKKFVRRRLAAMLILPCVLMLLIAAVVMVWMQLSEFRQDFARDLNTASDIIANNVTAAITFKDEAAATEILSALRAKKNILGAALVLQNGEVFARYASPPADSLLSQMSAQSGTEFRGGGMLVSRPVILDGQTIATLHVLSDYRSVYLRLIKLVIWTLVVMSAVAGAVGAVLSQRLQQFVAAPILRLTETARQVADKRDYSVRAKEEEGDEFGVLTRAFNQMLARIQFQDAELQRTSQELERQVGELQHEIAERKRAEQQLAEAHEKLVTASRQAGMAEVAAGVLHNVGNVLNSLNVSGHLVGDRLRQMRLGKVSLAATLLKEHESHLGEFMSSDTRGKLLPGYLAELANHLETERQELVREAEVLLKNCEHVKEIVAMHQSYARVLGVTEDLEVTDLIEDALRLQSGAFERHGIELRREYEAVPRVRVDKHKVLQILVNLLRNAKYAVEAGKKRQKAVSVSIECSTPASVTVAVSDNGIGIPPENLTRIFQHGFTTKVGGNGFGLHTSALAAREMGGRLQVSSDGPNQGATFALDLPVASSGAPAAASEPNRVIRGAAGLAGGVLEAVP